MTETTTPETTGPIDAAGALAQFEATLAETLAAFTDQLISAAGSVDLPAGYSWPNQLVPYLRSTDRPEIAVLVEARLEQRRQLERSQPHALLAVDAATGYCICGATFPGPPSVTVDAVLGHLQERAQAATGG